MRDAGGLQRCLGAAPMNRRTRWIIGLTALALIAAFVLPAVHQPLEYHDFADHRHVFGRWLDVDLYAVAGGNGRAHCGLRILGPSVCAIMKAPMRKRCAEEGGRQRGRL